MPHLRKKANKIKCFKLNGKKNLRRNRNTQKYCNIWSQEYWLTGVLHSEQWQHWLWRWLQAARNLCAKTRPKNNNRGTENKHTHTHKAETVETTTIDKNQIHCDHYFYECGYFFLLSHFDLYRNRFYGTKYFDNIVEVFILCAMWRWIVQIN